MDTSSFSYTTGSVVSKDGTTIGYRQMGSGPALILVHGGMQAAQNFIKLATTLSADFTVIVPDRRGRGLSGPYGVDFALQKEVEDIQALLDQTGAHYVFGLSSGAVISLRSALLLPEITKLAVYEPPLGINSEQSRAWIERYNREVDQGKIGAAMITVIKGTGDTSFFTSLPRFITVPLINQAIKASARDVKGDDVPLGELVRTMRYDSKIVFEARDSIDSFKDVSAEVLLLGGSKSTAYLRRALDRLEGVLPHARRIEFPGFDHLAADNTGHPEVVAEELKRFFSPIEEPVVAA